MTEATIETIEVLKDQRYEAIKELLAADKDLKDHLKSLEDDKARALRKRSLDAGKRMLDLEVILGEAGVETFEVPGHQRQALMLDLANALVRERALAHRTSMNEAAE